MVTRVHASGYRERNATADRTLLILGMFTDVRQQVRADEVAETLGVARSTAYRYIQSLHREGYLVERYGTYRLGPRVLDLARLARGSYELTDVAVPVMRELASRFGVAVVLTRRVGSAVVCAHREDGASAPAAGAHVAGSMLPPNAGAHAHVLFAWLPPAELRAVLADTRLVALTPRTIVGEPKLLGRYERARAAGFVVSHGEVETGLLDVSVPVLGADGRVVAGLGLTLGEEPGHALQDLVAALRESARSIGAVAEA